MYFILSTNKIKVTFKGEEPVGFKIIINNQILDLMNYITYLDTIISSDEERDIENIRTNDVWNNQ